jgi:hypothetical protein
MQPTVILVLRQSPDWGALARDFSRRLPIDPARFTPPMPVPGFPQNVAELIARWNAQMAVDFFSCRARLTEISKSTIARSPDVVRSDYREVDRLTHPNNAVLFFHDDDDWFAPDMAEVVSQIPPNGHDVCVFPLVRVWTDTFTFVRVGQDARSIIGRRQNFHFRYQSNNYGLNGRICDSETLRAMKDHVIASDYANKRGLHDCYVDRIVSVTAKTPCAASMLTSLFAPAANAKEIVRSYVDTLRALAIPVGFEWIAEGLGGLIDLFSQV